MKALPALVTGNNIPPEFEGTDEKSINPPSNSRKSAEIVNIGIVIRKQSMDDIMARVIWSTKDAG